MATLYSFGPFSAFYFGFYEQFKATAAGWHGVEVKALPMPSVIAASALAGSGAAWLSSPLDMIKLRIQVQRRSQEAAARAGKGAGEEGFTFAYRGMLDDGKTVDFLRVGRIALVYQTLDGEETGVWDPNALEWTILDDSYRTPIKQGLKIARKQSAPDMIHLPLPAASSGGQG